MPQTMNGLIAEISVYSKSFQSEYIKDMVVPEKKSVNTIDGELKATYESKQKPTFNRRMSHNLHRQCGLSELDKNIAIAYAQG